MIYGYMRVSTVGQIKGNSLEEQERILRQNGAMILFWDAFTGTKTSRPNFNKLLDILEEGDTLVITKLDRFARNTVEGIGVDNGGRISRFQAAFAGTRCACQYPEYGHGGQHAYRQADFNRNAGVCRI